MIDQNLIDKTLTNLVESLNNKQPTVLAGLYQLTSVLGQDIIDKLAVYLQSVNVDKWALVDGQETQQRKKISWDSDTVIEELHEVFNSVTPIINAQFPEVFVNFWGVSIWKDVEGYNFDWHTDNPDIDIAAQIYLYTTPGMGTVFGSETDYVLIPSYSNSGYLAVHSGENKIPHRTESTIPAGVTRYSLYAVWSRFPKHKPDA